MSRTLDQRRASFALAFITSYRAGEGGGEKLSTHVHKTPIRILQNGLGQALAYLVADAKPPARALYEHLQEWLCGQVDDRHPCRVYPPAASGGGTSELLVSLIGGDRAPYLRAQDEALRLFAWLKKFADAYLTVPTSAVPPVA